MILNFSITNFRSIKKRTEFTMLKSNIKGPENRYNTIGALKVLNSTVIYGPNASGKSNFILALKAFWYLIENSKDHKLNDEIAPYEPFDFDRDNINKPIEFEIDFLEDKVRYQYLILFDEKRIINEELYYYPKSSKALLFSRSLGNKFKFGDSFKGPKRVVTEYILENQLFLSKAATNKIPAIAAPYNFFENLYVFILTQDSDKETLSKGAMQYLGKHKDSDLTKLVNLLINALDTGISNVSVEEQSQDEFKFPDHVPDDVKKQFLEDYKYKVLTLHKTKDKYGERDVLFDLEKESAGTKSLLDIGTAIVMALLTGSVLVIDELEKSLHPNITRYLVNLFSDTRVNKFNAQLIFSTHDVTQIGNENFGRDQIWFMEKDENGVSELYRCTDIKGVRFDVPLDRWYASGRFGATPIINDIDLIMAFEQVHEKE